MRIKGDWRLTQTPYNFVDERPTWSRSTAIAILSQLVAGASQLLNQLQCAESTLVPGKKWFSGFFSIGSTQNPLLHP
jgi:hypothetical protein